VGLRLALQSVGQSGKGFLQIGFRIGVLNQSDLRRGIVDSDAIIGFDERVASLLNEIPDDVFLFSLRPHELCPCFLILGRPDFLMRKHLFQMTDPFMYSGSLFRVQSETNLLPVAIGHGH
jgi:hypothetical protein